MIVLSILQSAWLLHVVEKVENFIFKMMRIAKTSMSNIILTPRQILNMMTGLQSASTLFKQTGGLHNAQLVMVRHF